MHRSRRPAEHGQEGMLIRTATAMSNSPAMGGKVVDEAAGRRTLTPTTPAPPRTRCRRATRGSFPWILLSCMPCALFRSSRLCTCSVVSECVPIDSSFSRFIAFQIQSRWHPRKSLKLPSPRMQPAVKSRGVAPCWQPVTKLGSQSAARAHRGPPWRLSSASCAR